MNNEPTLHDVLGAISTFSSSVDDRFDEVQSEISGIKGEITSIRSQMVTKVYLDDKLSDLRGDLVVLVRKEDRKLAAVVNELVKRDVFDEATAERIFELEPFAK